MSVSPGYLVMALLTHSVLLHSHIPDVFPAPPPGGGQADAGPAEVGLSLGLAGGRGVAPHEPRGEGAPAPWRHQC